MDILRGPVWSRQDADLGMCRVDGVYIVTVCIRAHYMLVWGCSRVASGPFCACAAATATAVLFWWSVWLWSCCGVLGGRPLRWLVFRNTLVRWFVAEVTASTTPTHRAAVQERGNTDRTKDKENFLPPFAAVLVLRFFLDSKHNSGRRIYNSAAAVARAIKDKTAVCETGRYEPARASQQAALKHTADLT